MKQNITKSDLEQLSEKAYKKLYKWCESKGYIVSNWVDSKQDYMKMCPRLTIGQLIEFLDEHKRLTRGEDGGRNQFKLISWAWDLELCDCLWDAMKGVLKA